MERLPFGAEQGSQLDLNTGGAVTHIPDINMAMPLGMTKLSMATPPVIIALRACNATL